MRKALEDESMLVWAMNGEPLPLLHGYPLRMLCAGWPASVSGKWLTKILIRDRIHDGEKMLGQSYRVPCKPIAPGTPVADDDMCIIESMPVKSLITFPKSGVSHAADDSLDVRGHAWAGDRSVSEVLVSIDFGASWQKTKLEKAVNRLAWQHWSTSVDFPEPGYYEVWVRAVDNEGNSQPMVLPGWNPRGYLNNACHRIAVGVTT
jgi:DMSO/TMAO reductase YedYZ molybdopterin-dependent catalytic subunit